MNEAMLEVLKSPMVIGLILGKIMEVIHSALISLDKTDLAAKYGSQLHIITAVLTFLASASTLAASGHLSNLDTAQIGSLLNLWIPMLIGSKMASPNNSVKK